MTVEELREVARERDISGRSNMNQQELIEAIQQDYATEGPVPVRVDDPEPIPEASEADAHERIDALERRVQILESRLNAVDSRTLPSTQILGRAGP